MAAKKGKKRIKVQDLKPKKDAKGGVVASAASLNVASSKASPNRFLGHRQ